MNKSNSNLTFTFTRTYRGGPPRWAPHVDPCRGGPQGGDRQVEDEGCREEEGRHKERGVHGGEEEAGVVWVEEAHDCGGTGREGCMWHNSRRRTVAAARRMSRRREEAGEEEAAPPGRAAATGSAGDECREGEGRRGAEGRKGGVLKKYTTPSG
jgi:hypothetical protein